MACLTKRSVPGFAKPIKPLYTYVHEYWISITSSNQHSSKCTRPSFSPALVWMWNMDTLQETPEDVGMLPHVQLQINPKNQMAGQSHKPEGPWQSWEHKHRGHSFIGQGMSYGWMTQECQSSYSLVSFFKAKKSRQALEVLQWLCKDQVHCCILTMEVHADFECLRSTHLTTSWVRRRAETATTPTQPCPNCESSCCSRLRLSSHMRTHFRWDVGC